MRVVVLVLLCRLHYFTGVSLSQVRGVFASHLQMSLSEGGLCGTWRRLGRRVKRLFTDAVKLQSQREELEESDYDVKVSQLELRATKLSQEEWKSPDAQRLAARLADHGNQLFTFLWYDNVEATNNHADREVRPAVPMRKNSYQNPSQKGAQTQAVLMPIFRTLHRRGYNPLTKLTEAVTQYAATGQMPEFPPADGSGE